MESSPESRQSVFVARQPILDRSGRVYGYELLYRAAATDQACTAPGDLAGARVITDAMLSIGLDTLANGRPAFFNMTRAHVLGELNTVLTPASTVLELRQDIGVDAEIIEACRRLQKQGYTIALDDFVPQSDADALLPFAKFVKIDVRPLSSAERAAVARRLMHRVSLIAEKVETADVYHETRETGYSLFQGYYFCRPATVSGGTLPGRRLAYLHLLAALHRPDLTIAELDDLVKCDVSLCYRVLRCINSAAFGLRREIHSIRQALVMLGIAQVKKWASVWSLAGLNNGLCSELMPLAIIRARCCEMLGDRLLGPEGGNGLFLLGLCSLLDAMLGKPMTEAISGLPLGADLKNALLGQPNAARSILDAVIAYERGAWSEAAEVVERLGLSSELLPVAYADALRYARELSRDVLAA